MLLIVSDISTDGECNESDARLVTQSSDHEGIVQVCLQGSWFFVCDDGFDDDDAKVICSTLGFQREGGMYM